MIKHYISGAAEGSPPRRLRMRANDRLGRSLCKLSITLNLAFGINFGCVQVALAEASPIQIGFVARNSEASKGNEFQSVVDLEPGKYLNSGAADQPPNAPRKIILTPLTIDQMSAQSTPKGFDFLIVDPHQFVRMESEDGVSAIATLRRQYNNRKPTSVLGGVIFGLRSTYPNLSSADLRDKYFVAVKGSFAGCELELLELQHRQVPVAGNCQSDSRSMHLVDRDDQVLDAVRKNPTLVGFVRTGELELSANAALKANELSFLPHVASDSSENDFPFVVSTDLFPEWAFVAPTSTRPSLVKAMAIALLRDVPHANPLNKDEILSWTTPASYLALSNAFVKQEQRDLDYELLAYIGLFCSFGVALILFAEAGRHRRASPLNIRHYVQQFLPWVFAYVPPSAALILVILLIGSGEHVAESVLRHTNSNSAMWRIALTAIAFLIVAVATHYLSARTMERGILLDKLATMLEKIALLTCSASRSPADPRVLEEIDAAWEKIDKHCCLYGVTEEEFAALERRVKAQGRPFDDSLHTVDVGAHRNAFADFAAPRESRTASSPTQ